MNGFRRVISVRVPRVDPPLPEGFCAQRLKTRSLLWKGNGAVLDRIPPITPRRQQTRARLLAAGSEVFAKYGYEGTGIEVVCARAGFSRGAFYSNFSSKEEMLAQILEHIWDQELTYFTECAEAVAAEHPIPEGTVPSREHILQTFYALFEHIEQTPVAQKKWKILKLEYDLICLRSGRIAARVQQCRTNFRDWVRSALLSFAAACHRQLTVEPHQATTMLMRSVDFDLVDYDPVPYGPGSDQPLLSAHDDSPGTTLRAAHRRGELLFQTFMSVTRPADE
jgi:AcrR family transcriptional regulator